MVDAPDEAGVLRFSEREVVATLVGVVSAVLVRRDVALRVSVGTEVRRTFRVAPVLEATATRAGCVSDLMERAGFA